MLPDNLCNLTWSTGGDQNVHNLCVAVVDNKPLKIIDDDADNDDIDDNDNHSTSCVILFME